MADVIKFSRPSVKACLPTWYVLGSSVVNPQMPEGRLPSRLSGVKNPCERDFLMCAVSLLILLPGTKRVSRKYKCLINSSWPIQMTKNTSSG